MSVKSMLFGLTPKIEPVEGLEGVHVRVMSGAERFKLEKIFVDIKDNGKNALVETALICTCDESGERAFNDQDRVQITEMPSNVLEDIFQTALVVNKMAEKDTSGEVKSLDETQI